MGRCRWQRPSAPHLPGGAPASSAPAARPAARAGAGRARRPSPAAARAPSRQAMECRSICWVTPMSSMTPSRSGRVAVMVAGVRPSIRRAARRGHDLARASLHRDDRGLGHVDACPREVDEGRARSPDRPPDDGAGTRRDGRSCGPTPEPPLRLEGALLGHERLAVGAQGVAVGHAGDEVGDAGDRVGLRGGRQRLGVVVVPARRGPARRPARARPRRWPGAPGRRSGT